MSDGNDFLMRGGVPSVKFPQLGSTVIGQVTKPIKVVEVTDPRTKEVKRWPNGEPKMQVIIEMLTELRESDEDTGERTLWAKGQMQNAIRDAVRNSGARGILPGGVLQVTYVEDKPTDLQPQKIYQAMYWPPEQVPQQVPSAPWDQPAPSSAATAPAAAARPSYAPVQAAPVQPVVAARPVSAAPQAPVQAAQPQLSFLDRLRQTTAGQQAYQEQRQRGPQGQYQDDEPPF